ncbi:AbiH family protein [Bacteroides congonensis]|uniref:AbiH family protein n=1 Tax=Bacteroides congonensis TaxID=1871006 RepID=UPI00255AE1C0|nr:MULTISPECIES: AbiH family protein [Bacteroides]
MEKIHITPKDTCIVIGNGFDINLGLPTSYKDFVKSTHFDDMVKRGNELAKHLKSKFELQNWIDIENELKFYSLEKSDASFKFNYELLTFALINYLEQLDYSLMKRASAAYRLIESISESCDSFNILDYNYTKSIEIILRNQLIDEDTIKRSLIKVHGEAAKNDIIFGVEDSAPIKPEHVFLRKAYPRHYKELNLSSIFAQAKRIIFFGHSLGETDHTYFQNLFRYSCQDGSSYTHKIYNKNFDFLYYQEDGYHKLMQQIDALTSNNLTAFRQFNNVQFMDVEHL